MLGSSKAMQVVGDSAEKRADDAGQEDRGAALVHEAQTQDREAATGAREERQILLAGFAFGAVIGGVFLLYVILSEAELLT